MYVYVWALPFNTRSHIRIHTETIAAAQSPAQSSYVVIDENHLPDSQVEHAMLIQTQLEREERPFVCNSSNVDLLRHKFPGTVIKRERKKERVWKSRTNAALIIMTHWYQIILIWQNYTYMCVYIAPSFRLHARMYICVLSSTPLNICVHRSQIYQEST